MDPLLVIGVFTLGAAAGAILTHIRDRGIINWYRDALEGKLPETQSNLRTDELSGCEIPNRVARKLPNAAELHAKATGRADVALLHPESEPMPMAGNTLSSHLHQARGAGQ